MYSTADVTDPEAADEEYKLKTVYVVKNDNNFINSNIVKIDLHCFFKYKCQISFNNQTEERSKNIIKLQQGKDTTIQSLNNVVSMT